ncbi:hypothetical protein ACH427_10810 [Streptomyces sp. NPDC020379]|uniref:hypothetical protein n=1 Tax=Streptomyces sp. NPDC020379 TaxID=3365071 RepID=UPI0037B8ACE1
MSWPQNPQQPHQSQRYPEATAVDQPAVAPPPGGGLHAQPTVFAQPAVPPPPRPGTQPPPPPGTQPPPPPGMRPPSPYGMQPPPPAPAPQGKSNKTLLAVVGGVVTLAVVGGGAFFLLKDDKKSDEAKKDDKGRSVIAPDPGAKKGEKPTGGDSPAPSGAQPMVAGWQTQTAREYRFRYDVPGKDAQWNLLPRDTMTSYVDASGKPEITMRDVAHFREGGCSSSANPKALGEAGKGQLATVGTMGGDPSLSIQENARNWAGNWGFFAYGGKTNKPRIEVSEAKPWKRNGIDGWTATARVTVTNRPSTCVPATAISKSIVEKLPDGKFHSWVIYADQGVPDALPEAEIDKIMATVRPAKG